MELRGSFYQLTFMNEFPGKVQGGNLIILDYWRAKPNVVFVLRYYPASVVGCHDIQSVIIHIHSFL